jgi:hypothetical protein
MITAGNYILTTIGCFLLGLMLSRGSKPRPQKPAASKTQLAQPTKIRTPPRSPPTPRAGVRCWNCGFVSTGATYCPNCGSNLRTPVPPPVQIDHGRYSPQLIANNLSRLRAESEDEYVRFVQNLLMVDEQGNHWSIGVNSSKWYVQGTGGWVPSEPQSSMRLMQRPKPTIQNQAVGPMPVLTRKTQDHNPRAPLLQPRPE